MHLARVAKQGGVCILKAVEGLNAEKAALRSHEVAAGAGAEPVVRRALKEPNVVGVVWQMGTDTVGYHALHTTRKATRMSGRAPHRPDCRPVARRFEWRPGTGDGEGIGVLDVDAHRVGGKLRQLGRLRAR